MNRLKIYLGTFAKGLEGGNSNNDSEFPQINIRHESTDPGISENTKQDK